MRRIHLLLPAYQAADSVGDLLRRAARFSSELSAVTVVDDGSRDGTADAARRGGAGVLELPRNLGKGAALHAGFERALAAGADAIITMDADGQHLPEDLPAFFSAYRRDYADLIVGSRREQSHLIPPHRWRGNRFAAQMGRLFTGYEMDDLQCGYRLYTAETVRNVVPVTGGFATESEWMIRAHRRGLRVRNLSIRVVYDTATGSRSHYKIVRDSVKVFQVVPRSLFWWS